MLRSILKRSIVSTWGSNPGSLGYQVSNQLSSQSTPKRILNFEKSEDIQQVDMSQNHSAILTKDGKVYTFGSGKHGMLGHDNADHFQEPKLVQSLSDLGIKVTDVKLGDYHSLFLTEEGDVWSCGYGGKLAGGFWRTLFSQGGGALGQENYNDRFVPQPIQDLRKFDPIAKIQTGAYHALAMTSKNELLMWGKGECGVFGNGSSQNQLLPVDHPFSAVLAEDKRTIKDISVCNFYSLILTDDGAVFSWGRNDAGQLGSGMTIGLDMYDVENQPIQLKIPEKVIAIESGENSSIFMTENKNIYVCGLKLWWEPHKLMIPPGQTPVHIIAASTWAGYVTDKNILYFVGSPFARKDCIEIPELKLWRNTDNFFEGREILKITGKFKNHAVVLK